MPILERNVERSFVTRMKRIGVTTIKFTPTGHVGWPDRLVLIPGGSPLFIEFKRPGEVLRERQQLVHRHLVELGYNVRTFDDADKAVNYVIGMAHLEARRG